MRDEIIQIRVDSRKGAQESYVATFPLSNVESVDIYDDWGQEDRACFVHMKANGHSKQTFIVDLEVAESVIAAMRRCCEPEVKAVKPLFPEKKPHTIYVACPKCRTPHLHSFSCAMCDNA